MDDLPVFVEAAVRYAQDVREIHRRRTKRGNPQREADIEIALRRLKGAMAPVRTALGKAQFQRPSVARDVHHARLRDLSASIQSERRKLWKMQQKEKT